MITPDDKLPVDDAQHHESEDQQSQKDVHHNGLELENGSENQDDATDESDMLDQAYKASEPSFTLNLDDETSTKKD